MIWTSTAPTAGWDAAGAAGGLYYYRVRYSDCSHQVRTYQNWVEVIR